MLRRPYGNVVGGGQNATVGLDDLLPHRRAALLWRFAPELDYAAVDALVRDSAATPCEQRWVLAGEVGQQVAVLGDDGRYHLLRNGMALCGGRPRADDGVDVVRHKQWCHWWTDGSRYRIQAPADARGPEGDLVVGQAVERVASWVVTLTDRVEIPGLVPVRARCVDDLNVRVRWPGYRGSNNALGRLRSRLVREFGAKCSTCRQHWGTHVDHDHFTGRVRGLLCAGCNSHVDACPHASGCPFADYLNHPPAARLDLRYPRSPRIRPEPSDSGDQDADQSTDQRADERTDLKIAAFGFDPRYRGVKDEQRRAPHLPAPEHSAAMPSGWLETPLF
jgi:hypothetical protein